METVYYVGFYSDDVAKRCHDSFNNPAGTMKMNYIISCLKQMGFKVIVVSICHNKRGGYHPLERVAIDNQETHIYLPYFSIKVFGKFLGSGFTSRLSLKKFIKKNIDSGSLLITYHSLFYKSFFNNRHKRIHFKWIHQIEELYTYRLIDKASFSIKKEESYFSDADAFLFSNDIMPKIYASKKPFAISYGNYTFYGGGAKAIPNNEHRITYTGIINQERGVFSLLDSMAFLPKGYYLDILGFGEKKDMDYLVSRIESINEKLGYKKVFFFGTKKGKEYDNFLFSHSIGVSLLDTSNKNIECHCFPSKILSYLGHSLNVVASDCETIKNSRISSLLYLCKNNPKDIATAIIEASNGKKTNYKEELSNLEKSFVKKFNEIIQTIAK